MPSPTVFMNYGARLIPKYTELSTWQPILRFEGVGSGITYNFVKAMNTLIGQLCFFTADFHILAVGTGVGQLQLDRLPYPINPAIDDSYSGICVFDQSPLTVTGLPFFSIDHNIGKIRTWFWPAAGGGPVAINETHVLADTIIQYHGFYPIADDTVID